MSIEPRWTIAELEARYSLEPSLKDLFVEGQFDCEVLSQCKSVPSKIAYEIGCVDIPPDILRKYDLSDGNKQRVIALAQELAHLPSVCAFRCIVDRDLDHWFGGLTKCTRLIWTDYSSLYLYFHDYEIIKKIINITAKAKIDEFDSFLESFNSVLKGIYAIRAALYQMKWQIGLIDPDKLININGSCLEFDIDQYIRRLAISKGKSKDLSDFANNVAVWRVKLSGDPRICMNGHDFVDMIVWSIRNFKGLREFCTPRHIERLFVLLTSENLALDKFISAALE